MHLINTTGHPVTVSTFTGKPLLTLDPSEMLRLPETPGQVTATGMRVARFRPVTAVRGALPPERTGWGRYTVRRYASGRWCSHPWPALGLPEDVRVLLWFDS